MNQAYSADFKLMLSALAFAVILLVVSGFTSDPQATWNVTRETVYMSRECKDSSWWIETQDGDKIVMACSEKISQ